MAILTDANIRFAETLRGFVESEGIALTDDQLFDITGELLCDLLDDAVRRPPPDWHCIYWGEGANEGEIYSLCASREESLACVKVQADADGYELDALEMDDSLGLLAWSGEELYARIAQVRYEMPDPLTLKRVQTLLSPLRVNDQQGLMDALSSLPAWQVERFTRDFLWKDTPLEPLETGEWLEPYSNALHEYPAAKPVEQVLLPMWPTPNNMAKLLQQMLTPHAVTPPKLSRCQTCLAHLFRADSWQTLLAKYRAYVQPHVTVHETGAEKASYGVRFYRGPDHLLAWAYDLARSHKAQGRALYVSAEWRSNRLALKHSVRSRAELMAAYRVAKGASASSLADGMGPLFADGTEVELRAQAEQWQDHGYDFDKVYASDDDIADAKEELAQMSR